MIFFINPDKITKPLILIFHCFGLWRPRAVTGLVYQIYGILYLTFSCTLTTLMILHLTLLEDRSELSSALWAMLTAICITIKSIYIYAHNYELQQMVGRIRKFRLKNEKEHILVEKHLTLIYRVGTFLACSMFGAGYLKMITAPMFEKPTLPFEAWYPFLDWENSRRDYWLAVLLQFVGFNTVVIFVPVTDTLFSFMIFIVSIEFQIVGMRLEEIGGPSAMPRYNDEAKAIRELVECIKLHIRTLKFKESIQKFMNFPYSCYIAASGISISAIIAELVAVCNVYLRLRKVIGKFIWIYFCREMEIVFRMPLVQWD